MCFFFFNDTATTEIYTLSLHDALPICAKTVSVHGVSPFERVSLAEPVRLRTAEVRGDTPGGPLIRPLPARVRSEEHTSELQSRQYLVCRLLLEKKNNTTLHRVYVCSST